MANCEVICGFSTVHGVNVQRSTVHELMNALTPVPKQCLVDIGHPTSVFLDD